MAQLFGLVDPVRCQRRVGCNACGCWNRGSVNARLRIDLPARAELVAGIFVNIMKPGPPFYQVRARLQLYRRQGLTPWRVMYMTSRDILGTLSGLLA